MREVIVEVIREVPVEVIKEVPVPYVVEVIKEVPVEVIVEVPVIVEREVAAPAIAVSSPEPQLQTSPTTAATVGQTTDAETVTASLTEPEDSGPIRFYIGGQARLMSTLEGLIDVDPNEPVAKTFRIDILIDDQNRYYFTSDKPLVVPAGERVKFVVYNTHFTADECW